MFKYISEGCTHILGHPPEAFVADPGLIDRLIHEEDRFLFKDTSLKSHQNSEEWNWQGRVKVDGKVKWVEFRSNHQAEPDGIILRRGIIQDVTERKESGLESRLRYQSLTEKLPIGVFIHRNGILLFANAHASEVLKVPADQSVVGMPFLSLVHPDYQEHERARIAEVMQGIHVPMVEKKFVDFDGKFIDVECMSFPYMFQEELCVQVIFRDISDKKRSELKLRKNETLFTQLFENIPLAVVMLDESGKVFLVNKGFEEMFGFGKSQLKGKNLNDFIVPDELRSEGIDLNNLIAKNQVVSIETVRRHRDGRMVNVILCGVPVMLENETIGIYGVYVDITDRKKVEEELKTRNTELDNFVYKVSHDLRAPLSSILGLVNLAKLPGNTDNPLDYMEIIGEKVQALDNFINDVLSHSKNLKMEVNVSKVDVAHIINKTFQDLDYLEGASDVRRFISINGIEFFSDYWRISEIMRNLISNAIKYRQLLIPNPEIHIKVHVDHMKADITFSDNGIGIEEENLAKIFDMFYRATEQSDGSGIGLYIVKNAVDRLGGRIMVASRRGYGTRFHIILPNRINRIMNNTPTIEVSDEA